MLAWGCNRRGQCGAHQETASVDRMIQPWMKPCHTGSGDVVTDESKPSGHPENFQNVVATPTVVHFSMEKLFVKEVHCGWTHTLAITGDSNLHFLSVYLIYFHACVII